MPRWGRKGRSADEGHTQDKDAVKDDKKDRRQDMRRRAEELV